MKFNKINLIKLLVVLKCFFVTTGFDSAKNIRLASTTSTENSGLLKYLIPFFEKKTGYRVNVIVAGTGQALRMGRDGNVDALLVHAAKAERKFIKSGFGVNKRSVMYNDFIFVGPKNDPAKIFGESNALKVLEKIAIKKQLFVSRGDDSGTHKKEISLWDKANFKPEKTWYREVGQGMGRVLQISEEINAYTMTDRGTWLTMSSRLSLKILSEGDSKLHNPYSIIAVNPSRHPTINYLGAMSLIAWMTSVEGQKLINEFKINGETLFEPNAIKLIK